MYGQEIQNEEQLYNSFKEDFSVIVIDLWEENKARK